MAWLYNFIIKCFYPVFYLASFFNKKAKLWVAGRKNIFQQLEEGLAGSAHVIWMHCASLGEFEQGRPVLESLKNQYPQKKLLLTFFSPSGYEVRKNYAGADWVFYLPLDTAFNASKFLQIVKPELAIFVKYELWYNYLHELQKRNISSILISAIFTKKSFFFKWYGALHRKMLGLLSHIFVQDEESLVNLKKIIAVDKITVAGDTRFDRVVQIASGFQAIGLVESFTSNKITMVAGSTWPDDEKHLKNLLEQNADISLILAPHEINPGHLEFVKSQFPQHVLFSTLQAGSPDLLANRQYRVLIIDNIGMLSKLYYYGTINYIGGGFNKSGIHNTLEAAVYGKPVVFGPNYQKFREAIDLIKFKGGLSYSNDNELITIINTLLKRNDLLKKSGIAASEYVEKQKGATEKIMHKINQIFS